MDRSAARWYGAAGILGGFAVFAYVLLKQWLVPAYGGPPPFGDAHGHAFHMLETIPLVLLAAGAYGAIEWLRTNGDDRAATGAGIALGGALLAATAHAIEHILFGVFHSPLGNVAMAGFYLGWGVLAVGLTLVGYYGRARGVLGTRARALLVAVVPVGVIVALLLGTVWFRSYSDGFKLALGVAAVALGYRLRRSPSESEPSATSASSSTSS